MTSALRLVRIDLDAHLAQVFHDGTTLDEVVRTPVHIHIMNLLVELVGTGKDTIIGSLHIETFVRDTCQYYGWTQPLQFDGTIEDYVWEEI